MSKKFIIQMGFIILGIIFIFLGQYVFPYALNDKSIGDIASNVLFYLGIIIILIVLFNLKN